MSRPRSVLKLGLVFGALAAMAGCSERPSNPQPNPTPPIYEIRNADGVIEGWMMGTIHALPDRIRWRTDAIDGLVNRADYLIVEVATLNKGAHVSTIFSSMATTPGQPDLIERVSAELRPALAELLDGSEFETMDFSSTETWAAALMLARIKATGDPRNGVDRSLLRDIGPRGVSELEGAENQLRIFDTLPEADQRDLLEGVIAESLALEDNPDRLINAWLTGDEDELIAITKTGIMADQELREALLIKRNERWTDLLVPVLEEASKPLIAVGAGHLVGPDSVSAMLEKRGYSVTRLSH